MKTLSACRGLIGIADDGLRRVMRELLLGVKMHEFEFLADVGGLAYAIRASHQAFDLIIIQNDLPGGGRRLSLVASAGICPLRSIIYRLSASVGTGPMRCWRRCGMRGSAKSSPCQPLSRRCRPSLFAPWTASVPSCPRTCIAVVADGGCPRRAIRGHFAGRRTELPSS